MMTQTVTDQYTEKARTLLQQGYVAYNNWEIRKARLYWRKAATYDPGNEAIWVALLNVLQDEEDRKVCLQNILVLNPNNEDAEKRLRLLENDTQPAEAQSAEPELEPLRPSLDWERIQQIMSWTITGILMFAGGVILLAMLVQPLV